MASHENRPLDLLLLRVSWVDVIGGVEKKIAAKPEAGMEGAALRDERLLFSQQGVQRSSYYNAISMLVPSPSLHHRFTP